MVKKTSWKHNTYFQNLRYDLPASLVVFLVALPLCLGIAMASGAPPLSGLIAGISGGIIAGLMSGSALGVSGPAAGLAVIVLNAISDLGGLENLLVATVLAGILQIIFGLIKAGGIAQIFPSSVINGMLAGIGITIVLKQIPHLFGYDLDAEGEMEFIQMDGQNTFSELVHMLNFINYGAIIISGIAITILLLWQSKFVKKRDYLSIIPGPLLAVITGIILAKTFSYYPALALGGSIHYVNIPQMDGLKGMLSNLESPNIAALSNYKVYITALTLAIVASIETLLCVEATDKLDPYHKQKTPTNRELIAQGSANIFSGLFGGIPVTQVIVRSSANIQAGGKTKVSAIIHGFLLFGCVLTLPNLLNMIPLATLAAILLMVGFKLAKPAIFVATFKKGKILFLPFVITIVAMMLSDLLIGVIIGIISALAFIIWDDIKKEGISALFKLHKLLINSYKTGVISEEIEINNEKVNKVSLSGNVSFLIKAKLAKVLDTLPQKGNVEIDLRSVDQLHPDIEEQLDSFEVTALNNRIKYKLIKD